MPRLLFLSHTQISDDSRILKAIDVAEKQNDFSVIAIGIKSRGNNVPKGNSSAITDIKLRSRSLIFFPKIIRHIFSLLEFYISVIYKVRWQRIDIVYCNDDTPLILSVIIKFWKRSKLIYDAHELESDRNGISAFRGRLIHVLEKTTWSTIDHFITVSPSIQKWYNKEYGEKNSSVVYNTPQISFNDEPVISFRDKFQLKETQVIYLYLGKLMPGRGLTDIITAFSQLNNDYCFVMMGDGSLKGSLEKQAQELNCNNVFFHEPVQHDQVVKLAATADYGLCLLENVSKSDYLALPNKIFEYYFAGLPIIASNFPELKNFLAASEFGITLSSDQTIIEVIKNIKPRKEFIANTEYFEKFKWELQEATLSEIFDQQLRMQ